MAADDTRRHIRIYLVIQHLCGIHRQDLYPDNNLYKIPFTLLKTVYVLLIIFGVYTSAFQSRKLIVILWQYSIFFNWLFLMTYMGKSGKFFNALAKLDQKCGADDQYYKKVKCVVHESAIKFIVCVIGDAVAIYYMNVGWIISVILAVSMAAHAVEMIFYGLLIRCINIRLSMLDILRAKTSSKINRFILILTIQMSEHFQFEVFIQLAFILATCYISVIMVFLSDSDQLARNLTLLAWSGVKKFYLVWAACSASVGCAGGYRRLACGVARRIPISGEGEVAVSEEHKTLGRWYRFLVTGGPGFSAGDCVQLTLVVPLRMLEVLVSYLLLFVQFYNAYFMYEK